MDTGGGADKLVIQGKALRWIFQRLLDGYGPQHWWPGETPFEIMVGAVLTQNTAWSNVERAIANLKAAGALDADVLLGAPDQALARWLRPSGYFNVKARRLKAFCAWYRRQGCVEELAGRPTESLRAELLTVHGVGPETADDILLYAFERPVFVIDAYTRRLLHRLGLPGADRPYEELRLALQSALAGDVGLYNEFHALIVIHGKERCRSRPHCEGCPLTRRCGFASS